MINIDTLTPTQDERIMAALAHTSAIIPMMGVIAPIVIWATQKDKSQYVVFQALQAIVYQLCMIVAMIIGNGCYMVSAFSMVFTMPLTTSSTHSQSVSPLLFVAFIFPFVILGIIGVGGLTFIIYGIIAAIMVFQGKPFRYVIIGKKIERFLQPKQDVATNQSIN
jgi:uncharacterized Tic20 family protein